MFQTKEHAKGLLKTIAARRREQDLGATPMEDTSLNVNPDNTANMSMDMTFSPTS